MRIGVPKEVAPGESRVALGPHAVHELARAGHRVLVQSGAGEASRATDEAYEQAGAVVVPEVARVYEESELVVKVQGPVEEEQGYLREGLILFAFLSLPVNAALMQALLNSRCVAFAMETIRDRSGGLPVLTPMSEIAGRLTPQIGAHYLQYQSGGRGITARRVGRREAGAGRDPRLRHRRVGRRPRGQRSRGAGCGHGPRPAAPAAARGGWPQGRQHPRLDQHGDKGRRPTGGSPYRGGTDRGLPHAGSRGPGDRRGHEGRGRHRRCGRGSGRLRGDLEARRRWRSPPSSSPASPTTA